MHSNKIFRMAKRRFEAAKLGVLYGQTKTFTFPSSMIVGGKRKAVNIPTDPGTKAAFFELCLDDCYGLKQVSSQITRVLDIGANVGLFCVAARNAFPSAVIHSYEPNPDLERYLSVQAAAAECHYFMEAVGIESGKAQFNPTDLSVTAQAKSCPTGNVPQIGFRECMKKLGGCVDYLKVDCEGAEWELFRDVGAWAAVQNVGLEYHLEGSQQASDVLELLFHLGFRRIKHLPNKDIGVILAAREKN